ncbi:hypothetical protein SKA58_10648 [Sphingomonas sp. SKA58]|nr:hypothetical protein SKA58_10648 [Sphingomonas sp. SKA58]
MNNNFIFGIISILTDSSRSYGH